MANARVDVPATAKRGEIIEIRTLISHVMENGFRRTYPGVPLPRDPLPVDRGEPVFVLPYDGD